MRAFLGLDTSCYTTSVALVEGSGAQLAAERRLLVVPAGGRGLRQQEMVFQHVTALPELYRKALDALPQGARIEAVAASAMPRDAQGSYMPAFSVGESFGRAIADTMRVPFYATDHQSGHVEAALVDSGISDARHLAMHLSGGTTELLLCDGGRIEKIAGTLDISCGQLVDRVGVALGLGFPSGPELEALARTALEEGMEPPSLPGVSMEGMDCHISGAEAHIARSIQAEEQPGAVALAVYSFLTRLAARMLKLGAQATGAALALLAGGVASSALFRVMLRKRLEKERIPVKVCFALPELSGDNAVGVALIARKQFQKGTEV